MLYRIGRLRRADVRCWVIIVERFLTVLTKSCESESLESLPLRHGWQVTGDASFTEANVGAVSAIGGNNETQPGTDSSKLGGRGRCLLVVELRKKISQLREYTFGPRSAAGLLAYGLALQLGCSDQYSALAKAVDKSSLSTKSEGIGREIPARPQRKTEPYLL